MFCNFSLFWIFTVWLQSVYESVRQSIPLPGSHHETITVISDNLRCCNHLLALNIDAMVNLSSLFAGANPNRFFEVYGFVGPQLSVAKSANVVYTYDGNTGERTGVSTSGEAKAKARIGASDHSRCKLYFWRQDVC